MDLAIIFESNLNFTTYDNKIWGNWKNDSNYKIFQYLAKDNKNRFWSISDSILYKYYFGWQLFDFNPVYSSLKPIKQIAEDSSGVLWIIGNDGNLYKQKENQLTLMDNSNSPVILKKNKFLQVDIHNNKWIGTSQGLLKFNDTAWKKYDINGSGFPSNNIYSLCVINDEEFWAGTSSGLVKYKNSLIETKFTYNGRSDEFKIITDIRRDKFNRIWFGEVFCYFYNFTSKYNYSLHMLLDTTWRTFNENNSGLNNNPVQMMIDKNKNIYFSGRGLLRGNNSSLDSFNIDNSGISSNNIISFDCDFKGNIWIATDNGVSVFNEDGIADINLKPIVKPQPPNNLTCTQDSSDIKLKWMPSLSENVVYNIFKRGRNNQTYSKIADSINKLEFNTTIFKDTVYFYVVNATSLSTGLSSSYSNEVKTDIVFPDTTKMIVFNSDNSRIRSDYLVSLVIDSSDNVWYGTWGNGVGKFDKEKWSTITLSGYNQALTIDKFNRVWKSYWGSIDLLGDSGVVMSYPIPQPNGRKWVAGADSKGNIYAGGEYGLSKLDIITGKVVNDASLGGCLDGAMSYMAIDKNDNLWIPRYYNGLIKYDGLGFIDYTGDSSQVFQGKINFLDMDKKNNLWLNSTKGLVKYNGVTWDIKFPNINSTFAFDKNNYMWYFANGKICKYNDLELVCYEFPTKGNAGFQAYAMAIDRCGNKWMASNGQGLAVFNENGVDLNCKHFDTSTVQDTIPKKDTSVVQIPDFLYKIYPNPALDCVSIGLVLDAKTHVKISILNILGEKHEFYSNDTPKGFNQLSFDLKRYSEGFYVLVIAFDNKLYYEKFIIHK